MQNFLHLWEIEQLPEVLASKGGGHYYPQTLLASSLTLTAKGLSVMRITSHELHKSHVTPNEDALLKCQRAFELKDKGRYEDAREALGYLWSRVGERPDVGDLHPSVAAEVLLCVGVLTRWIGSKNQIEKAQHFARDLISESIKFYESVGDAKKVATARTELAYCYWREGSLDEARIMFKQALARLTIEGVSKANALLGLAVVEWADSRFNKALDILTENSVLFKKIANPTIKGTYHNQLAVVLEEIAVSDQRQAYFQRAIGEYMEAEHYFKLAQNKPFLADVKNNVGVVLFRLSRYKEAHRQLEEARRLSVSAKDKIQIAQIDETRAQILLAEKKFKEAETVAKGAVRVLERSGHQCLLADALITYATALARLKQAERARFTFQKAVDTAHQVGALNKAGSAALSLIEEVDEIPGEVMYAAFDRASEWLDKSQSQELLLRLNGAARKVVARLWAELKEEDAIEVILNKPCHLHTEVLKYESSIIRRALAQSNGSVTKAAALLDMSYQGLAYVINSRHQDLLKERSPVRRRARREQESEMKPTPGSE